MNRLDQLVDRVVESLLGETTYQVYHKFMGEIVCKIECPMFVTDLGYNQYEIEGYLNELKKSNRYNWEIPLGDYEYLDKHYGITDETIIRKIYFKYHIILFTGIINAFNNYQRKPINESTNRLDQLVEYVSNNLYQDTKYRFMYDYDDEIRVIITWPTEDGEQDYNIWDMEEWDVFYYDDKDAQFLDKHYGITDEDLVQKIFDAYIQKLAPVIYKKMEYLDNNREES